MDAQLAAWLGASAVLVCWCVGAYNRLVRLRQASSAAFRALAALLAERHRLVGAWLAATRPQAQDGADAAWAAADAACRQSQAAADHAAARPAAAAPMASLAVAEQVLRSALAQWTAAATEQGDFAAAVAAADVPLEAARERFNAASAAYNQAARQFPTRIVAKLFGFRAAGSL